MSNQKNVEEFAQEAIDAVAMAERDESFGPGNERWERRPLSELIEPVLGKTPKRSEDEFWGGNIQWASAKDISQCETRKLYDTSENMTEAGQKSSNAKVLPEGTVVVVSRGSVGESVQLGREMAFNQSCYALTTTDELLDDYLYYAWQYVFGQVQAISYGTVFDSITMKSFKNIEIPVPPLEDQRRIGDALGRLDGLIENSLQQDTLLNEYGDALFKKEIVNEESAKKPFNEIAKFVDGKAFSSDDWTDTGEPIIKITELNNGISDSTDWFNGDVEDVYELSPGDVLFAWSASLDIYLWKSRRGILNQHIYNVFPTDGYSKEFIYFALRESLSDFKHRSHGTTTQHINRSALDEVATEIMDRKTRKEFTDEVKPVYEKLVLNGIQRESLSNLQEVILPKLLSGEIRLPT